VYAEELGQHAWRTDGRLRDDLDGSNQYIVAAELPSVSPRTFRVAILSGALQGGAGLP
jgi:hypothetical protein